MFKALNCFLGFPERIFCNNEFSFDSLVNYYNGKRPCFRSVNRFNERNEEYISSLVNDHDSKLSWRIPYKEVKKLSDFTDKKGIDNKIICSGGKGFHFYIMFQEELVTDLVYSKVFSIQHSLRKYFELQSVDEPLFAKKGLLIRIPQTKHIALSKQTNRYEDNGNYCRYLTKEEFDKGLEHVEQIVKEPGEMPQPSTTKLTLDDIISLIPDYKYREKKDGTFNLDLNPGGVLVPTINAVGLPCLKQIVIKDDPDYSERLELASWLKLQNYRDMAIAAFFKNCGWRNCSTEKSYKIILSVKPRFPSCTFLRERYPVCNGCSFKR